MSRITLTGILAAAVADTATFALTYPTGASRGTVLLGPQDKLVINNQLLRNPADFGASFGATSVTVTNRTGATWAAGSAFTYEFDTPGDANPVVYNNVQSYVPLTVQYLNLGSPILGTSNSIWLSAALTTAAGASAPTGALMVGGVCDLGNTGRNVIAAWTGTAVLTITGKDMFGNVMVEKSASGTSFTGVKAFKIITSVSVSADVTAMTIGTGNVLGLPVKLLNAVYILKELQDGAAATAGTTVAGLATDTKSTNLTADVRGTYVPNSAPDGSKAYALICAIPDPSFLGQPQAIV